MYSSIPIRRGPNTIQRHALMGLGQFDPVTAAIGVATAAVNTWLNQIQLAHDADTATTQIVNGLAPKLQALTNAYLAGPGTCADQAAAMSAYMTAVNWLFSASGCGNGAYGSAGNRCISDRFGPGGPTDINAKWPWAAYYYWPIANDPRAAQCAAQLAADNPDAGLDSTVTNLLNPSGVQTVAGQYDTSGTSGTTAGTTAGTTTGSTVASVASGTVTIGGVAIPTEYLLLGGAAILLVVAMK